MARLTRILVTGSTGFIGAALCQALVLQGYQVRAFHRETSNLSLLKELEVEHTIGDLTQPSSLVEAMQGIDAVFHVAAMLSGGQPGRMYTVTVEGTRAVLDAALQTGVQRLVYTSSVAALGVPDQTTGLMNPEKAIHLNENHTWNFRPDHWHYAYNKYLAELEVQKAVAQGLDAVIVNPTYVAGPGDIYRKISSPIMQVASQKFQIYTGGGLNIVHLQDVVDGHLAALAQGLRGERYILGGENISLHQFLRYCADIAQVPVPKLYVPHQVIRLGAVPLGWLSNIIDLPIASELIRMAGYGFYYDTSKSRSVLGLPEPRSAEEAIRSAYEWFTQTGTA